MPIPRWKWIEKTMGEDIRKKPSQSESTPETKRKIPRWKQGIEEDARTPDVPRGTVVSKATDEPIDTPYDYLIQHNKGKERQRLLQAERVPGAKGKYTASMIAMRLAYGKLTPKQKAEFGYRYTDWKEIPVTEHRQHYGGKRHLESLSFDEKELLIERFKKEEPTSAFFYKEFYGGLYGKSDEHIRNQIWKGLTLTEEEQQKDFWKSIPDPIRWQVAGVHAFGSVVAWPITLPQSVVKLATGGKTLVLPDIGKELSKHKPSASPYGLLSTSISEGIGALTGKGSDAWSKFQSDPISGIFATVGELAGLKIGSIIVKGGLKTYRIGKVGLKYGKKDMLLYMRGEKVLAKSYPAVKGYPKIFRGGDKYASIWKYKGFGKKELVSLKEVGKLGKEGTMRVSYTPFGKRFEFRVTYESLKVKGLFSKTITKTYASTGKSHWVLEKGVTPKPVHLFTARDSGNIIRGFWKDTKAYQTLVSPKMIHARPMISGRMHHAGYLAKDVIKISLKDVSMGSLSSLSHGLGYLSASALSNELRKADRSLSVSKSAFKSLFAYDTVPSMASVSLLDFKQLQKTKLVSKLKSATLPVIKLSLSTRGKGGGMSHGFPAAFIPKIALLDLADPYKRKKKASFGFDLMKFAYHEREHKVAKMEDFLKNKSVKLGKTEMKMLKL